MAKTLSIVIGALTHLESAHAFRIRKTTKERHDTMPITPMNSTQYWEGVVMNSRGALQERLKQGSKVISYRGLWSYYIQEWVNLPGGCSGKVYDIYSAKCWAPGTDQCGNIRGEGDCYNREHSWPKSWWGGAKNAAYSDVHVVMPSDGFVNARRDAFAFGEVSNPRYTSREGHKLGPCTTSGFSGTCFEPLGRVKGALARAYFYQTVRYMNEFSCCSRDQVVDADLTSWTTALMLRWNDAFPPQAWERALNDRGYKWQGNRNPFTDDPSLARQIFG